MNIRDELFKLKITNLVQREKDIIFPKFIMLARKSLGITRRAFSEDTLLHEQRLYCLESGRFARVPQEEELMVLADYLGLPYELLLKKAHDYTLSVA